MLAEPGRCGGDLGDAGEPDGRRRSRRSSARRAGRACGRRRASGGALGEPGQPGEDRDEVGGDEVEALRHLQHQRGVDDVLRGRAEMEVAAELLRQPRLDRLGEGDDRNAGDRGLAAELGDVEVLRRDLLDRRRRGSVGDDPAPWPRPAPARPRRGAWPRSAPGRRTRRASRRSRTAGRVSAELIAEKVMA